MKKILLSMAVILAALSINAQSLTLTWDGVALGDTVVITPEDESVTEIVFHAIVNNVSDNNINVGVIRSRIELIGDAEDYFCWGACYPPFLDTAGTTILINAGAQSGDEDFSGHYTINGVVGVSMIKYTFYNVANEAENIDVYVKFNTAPDAIDEHILSNIQVSDAYPNPAKNFVDIDYQMPNEVETASIRIMNILGSVVKEQQISNLAGRLRINVSDINSGVYFYSVVINDEIIRTEKLIVK